MVRGSWGREERVNLIEEFYMTGLEMLGVMDGCDDDIRVAGGFSVLRERFWAIPLSCSKRREIPQVGKSVEADNLAVTVKEIDVSVVGIV